MILSFESGAGLFCDWLYLLLVVDPSDASLGKRLGRYHCLVSAKLLRLSVHNSLIKVDHAFIAADGFLLLRHCVALIAQDARLR